VFVALIESSPQGPPPPRPALPLATCEFHVRDSQRQVRAVPQNDAVLWLLLRATQK
jgi:hypothetical protein